MAIKRLTAALIVRDESQFIEDCLRSLIGWADEIIVVDTGSRDDTIEKARQFPVRLHHFTWCDDFSAARNFAIDQATGEWILYIDADERFQVPEARVLSDVLADGTKVAWNLRFHPRIDWTPYAELRLFRRHPQIRFSGVIHERMHDGIEALMRASGMQIGDCMISIQHVGYEGDQTAKNARNIPLLNERLHRDPDHLYSWWHLGQCLLLAADKEGAAEAWSSGFAAGRRVPARLRANSHALSAVSLIRMQIERGIDATDLVREAIDLYPSHLSLRWIEATLALEQGSIATARPILEMLAAIDPDELFDPYVSYDKAIFRYLAKDALALCRFRDDDFAEAARLYRLAAKFSPDREACEIKARLAELRAVA